MLFLNLENIFLILFQESLLLPLVEFTADQAVASGALHAPGLERPKAAQLLPCQQIQGILIDAVQVDVHVFGETLRELRPQADDIELSDDDIHSRSSLMIRYHKKACKNCDCI